MPNWNPSAPDVLGLEFLANHGQTARVWSGAPGRMQRVRSTATETITALQLSAAVNPLSRASIPTVIDVIPEGSEVVPAFAHNRLVPNSDTTNTGWVNQAGSSTNIFNSITDDVLKWPPATPDTGWIQATGSVKVYECSVNASAFAAAGAYQNGRVAWVEIGAILASTPHPSYRKLKVGLKIGGTLYPPAGGMLRDVHSFGAIYVFWWGELNPATLKPWTPADIANFGTAGTGRLYIESQTVSTDLAPRVHALRLGVYASTTENRAAVGVWERPEELTDRLTNIETTSLVTVPSGAANWAKTTGVNYLLYWRQSVSPALYGATIADDVRWNGLYQDLGPAGQPPGIAYPLHTSGTPPPPSTVLASDPIAYDHFGRPQEAFGADSRAVYAFALKRSDAAISVDSQPYRLDIVDIASVTSTQTLGQRIVPGSSLSYLGVRFPIIPPDTGNPTLTVEARRVSDNVLMGGAFTISASAARALPDINKWRYISGFLASGASLVSGTAYEIRLSTTSGGTWLAAMPNCSLAPTASFGGTTNGAFIGAAHQTNRDLAITLARQPDPPTGVNAAITNVAITTYAASVTTVQHVNVSWTAPAVGLGAAFARYELERQHDSGDWKRIANIKTSSVLTFQDHEAPRNTVVRYRVRAVATDGRYSVFNQSGTVTPTTSGSLMILTSNHAHPLEAVLIHDRESNYPLLGTEHDEVVAIHGADYQVAFMEPEDRGVGWRTKITLSQVVVPAKGGQHVLTRVLDLLRSTDIPYVCVMDRFGTQIFGHAKLSDADQIQPAHRYTAFLDVVPTHTDPVPVEVT